MVREQRTPRALPTHASLAPHASLMYSLTVKPCAQRHEWTLYLNAAMFTSTMMLDAIPFEARGEKKVREMVDSVRAATGRHDSRLPPRRVDGFEDKWTKVLYRGQELDQDMSWDDVGVFAKSDVDDETVVVTVVWKEIAAEGYKVATDAMDDVSTDEDEGEDDEY